METKHTPGPWRYCKESGSPTTGQHMIAGGKPGYLAEVRDCGSGDVEANARLIAAAPELLAAAKLVLSWYEAEEDHSKADFYRRMDMCRASEIAIRNAIAKATGASNGN